MPRSQAISVENNFSKGLITEATGLNFPENACTDTSNCVFEKIGSVVRRPGIDLENGYVGYSYAAEGSAVSEFLWKGAALSGSIYFVVIQVGRVLSFYSADSSGNIGSNVKSFVIDMVAYKTANSSVEEISENPCSFTTGNGLLFVAHPFCDTIYIEYDSDTDTIDINTITVKIRDVRGLPNLSQVTGLPMEANHRPTDAEFNQAIYYNVLNQGWYTKTVVTDDGRTFKDMAPLVLWRVGNIDGNTKGGVKAQPRTDWPSEADTWTAYKGPITPSLNNSAPLPPIAPSEGFSLQAIDAVDLGNSPTGKGHFILDALQEDRYVAAYREDTDNNRGIFSSLGDMLSFPGSLDNNNSGKYRFSQLAFYAGRVWYSGLTTTGYNTKIYFSQILDRDKNIDKCYQQQDPTSDISSDLLPDDGGVIEIPDIDKVIKLFTSGSSLLVFATNGIWRISGSASDTGLGFKANDYAVTKLGDVGSVSSTSFVDVEGTPVWWNYNGIWTIKADATSGREQAVSISVGTIQTFFDELPPSEIAYVKGSYNPGDKIIQWLYKDTVASDLRGHFQYSNILNLNTVTSAFYPWTIPASSTGETYIEGIFCLKDITPTATSTVNEIVVDANGVTVVDAFGVTVVSGTSEMSSPSSAIFKYVVFKDDDNLTFGNTYDGVNQDWGQIGTGGQDYTSYFDSGYAVRGQAMNRFLNNCIEIFSTDSVFDLFGKWDYAISGDTGKWSSIQRITTDDSNYSYQGRKRKIRGSGRVMQFRVNSVEANPFNIIGWSTLETGNQRP